MHCLLQLSVLADSFYYHGLHHLPYPTVFRFLQAQNTEGLLFSCRPLLYGILAHFLQGGHSDGRRLRGLKDESLLRPVSRG